MYLFWPIPLWLYKYNEDATGPLYTLFLLPKAFPTHHFQLLTLSQFAKQTINPWIVQFKWYFRWDAMSEVWDFMPCSHAAQHPRLCITTPLTRGAVTSYIFTCLSSWMLALKVEVGSWALLCVTYVTPASICGMNECIHERTNELLCPHGLTSGQRLGYGRQNQEQSSPQVYN